MVILVFSLYETFNIHWQAIEAEGLQRSERYDDRNKSEDNNLYLDDDNSVSEKIQTEVTFAVEDVLLKNILNHKSKTVGRYIKGHSTK